MKAEECFSLSFREESFLYITKKVQSVQCKARNEEFSVSRNAQFSVDKKYRKYSKMHGCFIEKFFMVNLLETLHSFRCNLIISHVPSQIIFGPGPDQTQEHDLNPKSLSLTIPLNEASCNDVIEKTPRLCVCVRL